MSTILTIRFQVSAIDPLAGPVTDAGNRCPRNGDFASFIPGIPGSSN
ncbi:hypothetical protein [Burkholderia sp. HI2714]|nr:hypothetical protein [Burkholderia sp. HI2714]